MSSFKDGYEYFEKSIGSYHSAHLGDGYVNAVNEEIKKLINDLNAFEGFNTSVGALKGDIAEFWHADTFNIDAVLRGSENRAYVERSHEFASADITTNFGEVFGLKYYKSAEASAKAQSVSIFQRFREYKGQGGLDSLEVFLEKRGYSDIETILNEPIYKGQIRIIPKDQLEDAVKWLERKILEESSKRPDQVYRYEETLNLLNDRIRDSKGTESIPLSKDDAEKLADLAKKGSINAENLHMTTEELVRYKYICNQAFKAGLSAATIAIVLRVVPEIFKTIEYLIDNGEIDEGTFKRIGFEAIQGGAEGFIQGSVSAAITVACKSGFYGEAIKFVDPSVVGAVTVIAINTMKNAFKVATGYMERGELVEELIKNMFVSTCSLIGGGITQVLVDIPVFGYMLGSFIGSMVGSFAYNYGEKAVLSLCIDTGFTMFGLVKQDYTLPEYVLKEIGVEIFEYENFEYDKIQHNEFEYDKFEYDQFIPCELGITFLRRGVIEVSRIGYV